MFDVLCSNCAHAVFNEQWGEWRCGLKLATIYDIRDANYCKRFVKKKEEKRWLS